MFKKSSRFYLITTILFLLLEGVTAWSQQPARTQPMLGERPSCYHKEFEELAFVEGDWEVNLNTRSPDGKWEETTAVSQIRLDLDGCLLMERFVGSRQKRPFHMLNLFAFDNNSKLLQETLTDSEHGLLALYQGRKIGGAILLDLELIRADGTKATVRRAYFEITNNSFMLENRRSEDGGKTWLIVTKARYSRKQ